jgi:hypothetical protein
MQQPPLPETTAIRNEKPQPALGIAGRTLFFQAAELGKHDTVNAQDGLGLPYPHPSSTPWDIRIRRKWIAENLPLPWQ